MLGVEIVDTVEGVLGVPQNHPLALNYKRFIFPLSINFFDLDKKKLSNYDLSMYFPLFLLKNYYNFITTNSIQQKRIRFQKFLYNIILAFYL